MRQYEKFNIQHFQTISKAQFHKRRKKPHVCKKDELVTITHTKQPSSVQDLNYDPSSTDPPPHRIKTIKPHDKHEVEKVGQQEEPYLTSTAVDAMKK
ncbi:hypothetical protein TNCT_28171 [Trichonephila clavata]|uniref:Uncharacterized protein n=1 Tax=Trichonephila clavata TaxID=2740835 RepID=A0A8X6KZH6_TRICU|nr:hypothetical protein TNCT_28171 [Trichonephila clavata]